MQTENNFKFVLQYPNYSHTYMYNAVKQHAICLNLFSDISIVRHWHKNIGLTTECTTVVPLICGLVTPYGDKNLGHNWLKQWLVARWHQAIIWTNVDLSSVRSHDTHLTALSSEALKIPVSKTTLKIEFLISQPVLQGGFLQCSFTPRGPIY